MKVGIIIFPGSNCDHDAEHCFKTILNLETKLIWHKESSLGDVDFVFIPGGFSFGDYLRCGSIARFSPIMNDIIRHAKSGKPVMGVCNGFQILSECALLPGALIRNQNLKFICETIELRVETNKNQFTSQLQKGQIIRIPIAHGEGNYTASSDVLSELNDNEQILFRYSNTHGEVSSETNPNGSQENIAGIVNKAGNVLGMMPHPERAVESFLGSDDGLKLFHSILQSATEILH